MFGLKIAEQKSVARSESRNQNNKNEFMLQDVAYLSW